MSYFLKEGYKVRTAVKDFTAPPRDSFQNAVYDSARKIAVGAGVKTVVDIGCGSGVKLVERFASDFKIHGVEMPHKLQRLRETYPDYSWGTLDEDIKCDLMICADVIEHFTDPDELLDRFLEIDFGTCVLSTPERDRVRGKRHMGPPGNQHHAMEWNFRELRSYIGSKFSVKDHFCVPASDGGRITCQVIVFEKQRDGEQNLVDRLRRFTDQLSEASPDTELPEIVTVRAGEYDKTSTMIEDVDCEEE